MVQLLQDTAQWWEELLLTTAGKLELNKCFYYIIDWVFNKHGQPQLQDHKEDIIITNHTTGKPELINQKVHTEAHKTLGIFLAPQNNHLAATQLIYKKTEQFARQITANTINNLEANLAHDIVYNARIWYGMHVITTNKKTLDKIQAPMIKALLPAMGYNCNIPKEIRHSHFELGGVGFVDCNTICGLTKVQKILEQLRLPRCTGETLMIYLHWTQVLAGTSIPILDNRRSLPHITDPWITMVLKFLNLTNSGIDIQGMRITPLRQEQDCHIMDHIINSARWTAQEIEILNYWRLYLRIETISDMTDGSGTRLLRCF
jgi:hypothetical protein